MTFAKKSIFYLLAFILLNQALPAAAADAPGKLNNPGLVDTLFERIFQQPYWTTAYPAIRQRFLAMLDSASYYGLDREKYHYAILKDTPPANDSAKLLAYARLFIDGVVTFGKDLQQGNGIARRLANDEISRKYAATDNAWLVSKMSAVSSAAELSAFFNSIEPNTPEFASLKAELARQLSTGNSPYSTQITTAMNFQRWINHFHFDKYIVVNIPSAMLNYYENGTSKLNMKVVAGKKSTPTPIFSSYCNQVILYPYWNVPGDIAVKELIPKFRKKPSEMDEMNMSLIDKRGQVVDHHSIDWSTVDASNFPYIVRQGTGCSNALGVIKFNLTDPFDVYMHDTNLKNKFLSTTRYFSHGCIRLERPLDLANMLLPDPIDPGVVEACSVGLSPSAKKLDKPIPVFVVYMTPEVTGSTVQYNKDVYALYK